jgi:hypothetical protein
MRVTYKKGCHEFKELPSAPYLLIPFCLCRPPAAGGGPYGEWQRCRLKPKYCWLRYKQAVCRNLHIAEWGPHGPLSYSA